MNFTGDPYQRLDDMENKDHKYLDRFQELSERIDTWKQVGPACTEHEWTGMEEALEDVNELVRLCTANGKAYKVPAYRLKKANRYWKQYSIMNIETVKIAAGTVADIFKQNKEKRNG